MLYTLVIQFNVSNEKEREEKKEKNRKNKHAPFLHFDIKLDKTNILTRGPLVDQYLVYPPLALMTAASLSGMEAKRFLQ